MNEFNFLIGFGSQTIELSNTCKLIHVASYLLLYALLKKSTKKDFILHFFFDK